MSYINDLDLERLPRHIGIVMDGNGRWAKQRGLPRTEGHAAGEEALFDTVEGALDIGLRWLTVYAFSTENWRRPPDEVRYLMNFNRGLLRRRRDELNDRGARIHAVFPTEVLAIEYLERNPKPGTEGDPPSPPWWVDVRALRDAEASGPAPPPA